MSEKSKIESVAAQAQSRREFVKTSAKVAIAAPAVALLLDASTKSAQAASTNPYDAIIIDGPA
jgi:hypothetical protein